MNLTAEQLDHLAEHVRDVIENNPNVQSLRLKLGRIEGIYYVHRGMSDVWARLDQHNQSVRYTSLLRELRKNPDTAGYFPMPEDGYMNVVEASDFLRLSTQTLYTKVYLKTIPYFKIGDNVRFRRDILDKWIERGGDEDFARKAIIDFSPPSRRGRPPKKKKAS